MSSRLVSFGHSFSKNGFSKTFYLLSIYLRHKYLGLEKFKYSGHQFYLRKHTTDFAVFREIYFDHEYVLYANKKINTILDLGANIGLASVYLAKQFPEAKIYALEADEENFLSLKENVRQLQQVEPLHRAIWNANTTLFIEKEESHWARKVSESGNSSFAVQAVTLQQLIEDFGLERINILKVDIEGAELPLFEYLKEHPEIMRRIDYIIIETHDWIKVGCAKSVFDCLHNYNYSLQILGEKFVIELLPQ